MNHENSKNPSWWTAEHTSAWERAKAAIHRDWEQTKADFSNGGEELNQGAGDTIKQAAGKEHIPPEGVPNTTRSASPSSAPQRGGWNELESAFRYGYGARHHYRDSAWNDEVEGKLRSEWEQTNSGTTWEHAKHAIRRGWDSMKQSVQ